MKDGPEFRAALRAMLPRDLLAWTIANSISTYRNYVGKEQRAAYLPPRRFKAFVHGRVFYVVRVE